MSQSPICFINPDSINVTPYFKQYKKCLNVPYDLIYWNRGQKDEVPNAANVFRFDKEVAQSAGFGKLKDLAFGYLGFRSYANRILESKDYDFIVALTGNAAAILSKTLSTKYKGRYIVDIRDYFLESVPLYKRMETRAIRSSAMAVISSPGYRNFLCDYDFQLMHNVQEIDSFALERVSARKRPGKPFVLSSIGTAKNLKADCAVIDYFANDERFMLRFIGRGYDSLRSYIEEKSIDNVKLIGEFESKDTLSFYESTDAILSYYGNEKMHFRYQLTNKLYYAVQLGLPMVVCPGTTMGDVVSSYSLGCVLDLGRESCKKEILAMFDKSASEKRKAGAGLLWRKVERDNEKAEARIEALFDGPNS